MRKYWNVVKNKLVNGLEINLECVIITFNHGFSVFIGEKVNRISGTKNYLIIRKDKLGLKLKINVCTGVVRSGKCSILGDFYCLL